MFTEDEIRAGYVRHYRMLARTGDQKDYWELTGAWSLEHITRVIQFYVPDTVAALEFLAKAQQQDVVTVNTGTSSIRIEAVYLSLDAVGSKQ